MAKQMNFFDLSNHYARLSSQGDPLERLLKVMDCKIFLPLLEKAFAKASESLCSRKISAVMSRNLFASRDYY